MPRTWLVELVDPPGCFMTRLADVDSLASLEVQRHQAAASLPLTPIAPPMRPDLLPASLRRNESSEPLSHRYLLLYLPEQHGELARTVVELLARTIPDPSLPWTPAELESLVGTLSRLSPPKT